MKEILGGSLDLIINQLNISAIKTFDDNDEYQVWEMEDHE